MHIMYIPVPYTAVRCLHTRSEWHSCSVKSYILYSTVWYEIITNNRCTYVQYRLVSAPPPIMLSPDCVYRTVHHRVLIFQKIRTVWKNRPINQLIASTIHIFFFIDYKQFWVAISNNAHLLPSFLKLDFSRDHETVPDGAAEQFFCLTSKLASCKSLEWNRKHPNHDRLGRRRVKNMVQSLVTKYYNISKDRTSRCIVLYTVCPSMHTILFVNTLPICNDPCPCSTYFECHLNLD